MVVGDEEAAAEIEHRDNQAVGFHPDDAADWHFVSAANGEKRFVHFGKQAPPGNREMKRASVNVAGLRCVAER